VLYLSFIDMFDMEVREVIHNLAAYLAHHQGVWVYKYFAAEDVKLDQTCCHSMDIKIITIHDNRVSYLHNYYSYPTYITISY
jgi:hypothetical protein